MQFTLKMSVAAPNGNFFSKTPYFRGSRSFNVIDVDSHKKLVTSACYVEHHVCAYMQPFFTPDEPTAVK